MLMTFSLLLQGLVTVIFRLQLKFEVFRIETLIWKVKEMFLNWAYYKVVVSWVSSTLRSDLLCCSKP